MSVSLPSAALACPVCFSAKDESARVAFLGTTIFMTALPLVMIGGLIYWLAARSIAIAKDEQGDLDVTEESPAQPRSSEPAAARSR